MSPPSPSHLPISDFDTNGLLHWIGTNGGTAEVMKDLVSLEALPPGRLKVEPQWLVG